MNRTLKAPLACVLAAFAVLAAGCAPSPDGGAADGPLAIVTTTGMIGDTVSMIAGERANVVSLMGPGVDPHLYKASEGDVRRLAEADAIFYNGLHLEGKMTDIFVKMARSRRVVPVTESIDPSLLREPPEFAGQYDPHVWFDVSLWRQTVDVIADTLAELDPQGAATYRANAEALRARLDALDAWVEEQLVKIPQAQRVLVTAHDAFGYFGRRYGLEVVGLQGISTASEAGLDDVGRVVDIVVSRRIPAIFVESSVPRQSIEAVRVACRARGFDVAIGGELFSDSMGAPGTVEGTYEGMVRANVDRIVAALTGAQVASEGADA